MAKSSKSSGNSIKLNFGKRRTGMLGSCCHLKNTARTGKRIHHCGNRLGFRAGHLAQGDRLDSMPCGQLADAAGLNRSHLVQHVEQAACRVRAFACQLSNAGAAQAWVRLDDGKHFGASGGDTGGHVDTLQSCPVIGLTPRGTIEKRRGTCAFGGHW